MPNTTTPRDVVRPYVDRMANEHAGLRALLIRQRTRAAVVSDATTDDGFMATAALDVALLLDLLEASLDGHLYDSESPDAGASLLGYFDLVCHNCGGDVIHRLPQETHLGVRERCAACGADWNPLRKTRLPVTSVESQMYIETGELPAASAAADAEEVSHG